MKKLFSLLLFLTTFCYPINPPIPSFLPNVYHGFAFYGIASTTLEILNCINKKNVANVAIINIADNHIHMEKITQNLINATLDSTVHGTMLIIDCRGGQFNHFCMLHDLIKQLARKKPVVGLICGDACSGGYLCASACTYIVSFQGADIGNIGITTIIERKNKKESDEFNRYLFYAGKHKALYNRNATELSEADYSYIQQNINRTYKLFLKLVAENRNLSPNNYHEWAEGKIFDAYEALDLQLIDKIGTNLDADSKLAELIGESTHTPKNKLRIKFIDKQC